MSAVQTFKQYGHYTQIETADLQIKADLKSGGSLWILSRNFLKA